MNYAKPRAGYCSCYSRLDGSSRRVSWTNPCQLRVIRVGPASRRVRFAAKADIRPVLAFMGTRTSLAPSGILNQELQPGIGVVRFGLALHIGRVLYGKVGGGNRLDFTCIGPVVILPARMEKLAAKLGRVIVASDEFARHCGADFQAIGKFPLAGFASEQNIFGASDETTSPVSTTSYTSTGN